MGLRVSAQCRVVIDNDWAGDPDGLLALAHHLLSPGNRVDVVTSSTLAPMFGDPTGSAVRGARLADELIALIGDGIGDGPPDGVSIGPVAAGADAPFDGALRPSAAADAIVAAARGDDPLPLIVVCAGPLTNVADALVRAPDIAERFELVWVGGSGADAEEYNRDTDPAAADFVFAQPGLAITTFPLEVYRRVAVTIAELRHDVGTAGVLGAWLWERFDTLPIPDFIDLGEIWALGDSATLIGTAVSDQSSDFEILSTAPVRRRCAHLDTRLLVGDLHAKLRSRAAASRDGDGVAPSVARSGGE